MNSFLVLWTLTTLLVCQYGACKSKSMPLPWTEELTVTTPPINNSNVLIATTLMSRCPAWPTNTLPTSVYNTNISNAVKLFQKYNNLIEIDGTFGPETANITLLQYSDDGFVDGGVIKASDYNASYKVHIKVHDDYNRDIEVTAQLLDKSNILLYEFQARLHGESNPEQAWPDYNNEPGYNQFTGSGNTPTGLSTLDLNTPEDNSTIYGPYNIHRVVSGIIGNSLLMQPNIRDGILIHTGEWPKWDNDMQMPNSAGCIHIHPSDLDIINTIVQQNLGVVARPNTDGGKNYPYKTQGIISIELIR